MKKIVFVIAAISILFYFEASAINKNFSPSNFVKIEPLIHSLDLVDSYEYTGTSHEDPEFEITKFAGFEFGSDIYCRKGELGVLRNATPRKSDGLYHPYSVIRSSVIEIEGGFHGFNTVEARYSYLSRKLMSLSFSVRTEGELSRHIFDGFLTVLKEKYGITPSDLSIRFFDGNPLFHSKIGKVSITGGVRKLHRENMEVYFLISNSKYGYVADKESKMVIENPPNEVIRKWVNGFKSKPRYINRNRIQGKICKNGSVRPRFGGLGIGDIVTNAVLISKSMKFEDGRWLQHKRWTVPMTDPTFGFTNAVTVVTENSNTISGIEITDFFSVDPKKDNIKKVLMDTFLYYQGRIIDEGGFPSELKGTNSIHSLNFKGNNHYSILQYLSFENSSAKLILFYQKNAADDMATISASLSIRQSQRKKKEQQSLLNLKSRRLIKKRDIGELMGMRMGDVVTNNEYKNKEWRNLNSPFWKCQKFRVHFSRKDRVCSMEFANNGVMDVANMSEKLLFIFNSCRREVAEHYRIPADFLIKNGNEVCYHDIHDIQSGKITAYASQYFEMKKGCVLVTLNAQQSEYSKNEIKWFLSVWVEDQSIKNTDK